MGRGTAWPFSRFIFTASQELDMNHHSWQTWKHTLNSCQDTCRWWHNILKRLSECLRNFSQVWGTQEWEKTGGYLSHTLDKSKVGPDAECGLVQGELKLPIISLCLIWEVRPLERCGGKDGLFQMADEEKKSASAFGLSSDRWGCVSKGYRKGCSRNWKVRWWESAWEHWPLGWIGQGGVLGLAWVKKGSHLQLRMVSRPGGGGSDGDTVCCDQDRRQQISYWAIWLRFRSSLLYLLNQWLAILQVPKDQNEIISRLLTRIREVDHRE